MCLGLKSNYINFVFLSLHKMSFPATIFIIIHLRGLMFIDFKSTSDFLNAILKCLLNKFEVSLFFNLVGRFQHAA